MKQVIILLLGSFLSLSTFAQSVTLTFRNANNQNRNYRVLIDGSNYYSTNGVYSSDNSEMGSQRTLTINNLRPGSHTIAVYNLNANNTSTQVYTNNFQLRENYDMFIAVNNGRISFSEKTTEQVDNSSNNNMDVNVSAMAGADFDQLVQEIRSNRYQSARTAAIREAIASTDRFNSSQLKQMIVLVKAESTRLELAKSGYAVVTDPNNYTGLNSLFTSQANRNALRDYIQLQVNNSTGVTMPGNNNGNNNGTGNSNQRSLLSTYQYDQLMVNLNNNNYQSGKYTIIRDAFNNVNTAFTTAQIRQLLGTITSEPDRLFLAKQAYSTAYDPANFSTLLNMFSLQASRTELNNYIVSNGGTGGNVYVKTRTAMSDASFSQLLKNAGDHLLPWDKVKDVKAAFSDPQNNFSSVQARQLMYLVSSGNLLAVSESSRLELAKLSYARIIDPENFNQIMDLFTIQSSRDELDNYIKLQVQN